MANRSEAWRELGGNDTELTPDQELAIFRAGLGNDDMRARVQARLDAEKARSVQDSSSERSKALLEQSDQFVDAYNFSHEPPGLAAAMRRAREERRRRGPGYR